MGTSARIDELRKKFDENPRRYFAPLANEYRKAGDLEQAISICQEYLPQQPGHMSGHIVYGQALYESGRDEEAKAVFETALSLDPENLIALRHLGDIARASGDAVGARGWYQRVLDADPRNDEIIQLLSSLDSIALESPPPFERKLTPLSMAAVEEMSAPDEPADRTFTQDADIEKSQEALPISFDYSEREEERFAGRESEVDVPPLPPSHPMPAASTANDDLLDLDDFSLGDVETGSFTPSAPSAEPAPVGLDGDVTISGGFALGSEDEAFERDAFSEASTTPSPDIQLATDINLGLTNDFDTPSASGDETPSLAGLETFEAGVIGNAPAEVPVLETETFFDLPPVDAGGLASSEPPDEATSSHVEASAMEMSVETESAPIDGGHDGREVPESISSIEIPQAFEAPATEPAEAFVTETMAELYIQQGHLDSAAEIYRKLVEERPDEPELRDRLRAIEDRISGAHAARNEPGYPTPPPYGGPTIREFLLGLVGRRAGNGGVASPASAADQPDHAAPPSRQARMTPGASETVSGSIDALFSGAHASVSDTVAADALAAAFARTVPEPASVEPSLEGTPAHRATDELSLDHVFKANTPPRSSGATNGFSFDQFFAEEMTDPAAESTGGDAAPGSPDATDDIAQFNAWLNGLKKT
ncbi:MAG TPA: tetratricopeptide repeat protein [Gemmatimonadaceae bacterium]|jgi:tetratricopeptide (TPR) repeat protein|nr:tetratricopeptide repeat protein [Gemmatimonadaceae bacterium]